MPDSTTRRCMLRLLEITTLFPIETPRAKGDRLWRQAYSGKKPPWKPWYAATALCRGSLLDLGGRDCGPRGMPPPPMEVVVNGEARVVAADATVAMLISELGLDPHQVAVERNRDIVPRAQYPQVALEQGDHLEIVTFVGGG